MPVLDIVASDFLGLAGLEERLGADLTDALRAGEAGGDDPILAEGLAGRLGPLSVRLRGFAERPFEALEVVGAETEPGRVTLRCRSEDRLASVALALDFRGGSVDVDIARGLERVDSGTFRSAVLMAARNRFVRRIVEGAVLEVVDAEDCVLARAAPRPYQHIDPAPAIRSYRVFARSWEAIAAKRLLSAPAAHVEAPAEWLGTTFLSRLVHPAF